MDAEPLKLNWITSPAGESAGGHDVSYMQFLLLLHTSTILKITIIACQMEDLIHYHNCFNGLFTNFEMDLYSGMVVC